MKKTILLMTLGCILHYGMMHAAALPGPDPKIIQEFLDRNINSEPHQKLGIKPDSTRKEINTAFRKLALTYHPNRQSYEKSKELAPQAFRMISNAQIIMLNALPQEAHEKEKSVTTVSDLKTKTEEKTEDLLYPHKILDIPTTFVQSELFLANPLTTNNKKTYAILAFLFLNSKKLYHYDFLTNPEELMKEWENYVKNYQTQVDAEKKHKIDQEQQKKAEEDGEENEDDFVVFPAPPKPSQPSDLGIPVEPTYTEQAQVILERAKDVVVDAAAKASALAKSAYSYLWPSQEPREEDQ